MACFRLFLDLEKSRASLEEERRILKAIAEDIREHLASLNKLPSKEVDLWLESVARLAEYDKLERSSNIRRRFQLGEKVRRELQYVRKLYDQRKRFTTLCRQRPPRIVARAHEEPVGMESLLIRLRGHLDDERSSIIGIHGPPGVGKTTLLSAFNNQLELEERDGYDVVIFIKVSDSQVLDVALMQWTIFRRLGLLWDDVHSEAMRAEILREALMTKKFVILVDDVNESFKLEQVGIPDPSATNVLGKLFLASRCKDVCFRMEVRIKNMIEVKSLESESAWVLFHRYLDDEAKTAIDGDSNIRDNAKAIVHSCSGLPLAIKAVGRYVASLTDLSSWEKATERVQQFSPEDLI